MLYQHYIACHAQLLRDACTAVGGCSTLPLRGIPILENSELPAYSRVENTRAKGHKRRAGVYREPAPPCELFYVALPDLSDEVVGHTLAPVRDGDHIGLRREGRTVLAHPSEPEGNREGQRGDPVVVIPGKHSPVSSSATKLSRNGCVADHCSTVKPKSLASRSLHTLCVSSNHRYTPSGLCSITGRNCSASSRIMSSGSLRLTNAPSQEGLQRAYSSQASTFTCWTILPSCNSSVVAARTRVPSGYSQASLNATRSSPTTSRSMRCVIARPQTSRRYSVICSLPYSSRGELGVV